MAILLSVNTSVHDFISPVPIAVAKVNTNCLSGEVSAHCKGAVPAGGRVMRREQETLYGLSF
eukprot:47198-Amphidinium_carterae.1